jgi:hypothetical protein
MDVKSAFLNGIL